MSIRAAARLAACLAILVGLVLPLAAAASGQGDDRRAKLEATLDAAQRHQAAGELERALQLYVEATRIAPKSAPIHARVGYILGLLERTDDALAAYDRAVRLDRKDPLHRFNRAVLRRGAGDLEGALRDLDRVIGSRAKLPSARIQRAMVRRALLDPGGAADDLDRWVASRAGAFDPYGASEQIPLLRRVAAGLDRLGGASKEPADRVKAAREVLATVARDGESAVPVDRRLAALYVLLHAGEPADATIALQRARSSDRLEADYARRVAYAQTPPGTETFHEARSPDGRIRVQSQVGAAFAAATALDVADFVAAATGLIAEKGEAREVQLDVVIYRDRAAYRLHAVSFDYAEFRAYYDSLAERVETYRGDDEVDAWRLSLFHESAHAVVFTHRGRLPRWLSEGVAEWLAPFAPHEATPSSNRAHRPRVIALAQARERGRRIPTAGEVIAEAKDADFAPILGPNRLAYARAWSIVATLAHAHGTAAVRAVLAEAGTDGRVYPDLDEDELPPIRHDEAAAAFLARWAGDADALQRDVDGYVESLR